MKVYKYTDNGGLRILSDLTIKAAAATAFNDPFELTPAIPIEQFSVDRVRRAHEHPDAKEQNRQYLRKVGLELDDDAFESMWSEALPEMISKSVQDLPRSVELVREKFAVLFSERFRIFCTSLCYDSILMWSHYADCHRGFVVELDLAKGFLDDTSLDYRSFKVVYNDRKAVFDAGDPMLRANFDECLERVVSRKARAWKYEKEFRFVMPAIGDGAGLYRIKPGAISKVIVGARSDQLVEEVRYHLERPELAHVTLEQAEISSSHYRLGFRKVRRQA